MTRQSSQPDQAPEGSVAAWKIAAVWTVPAVLSTVETVMFARIGGHPIAVWRAFIAEAPQWYGWAILTPGIIALWNRFPLHRPLRPVSILVHTVASLVAGLVLAMGDAIVNSWARPSQPSLFASTRNWFLGGLPATTLAYFAILGASYAWQSAARLRARERQAAALESQLREAQLAALRMQLQPHFLFNSLNAVMALVRDRDTDRAIRALSLLSDVLRATVNAGESHETTLAREIDFVTRYLSIEQVRFGDRLRVTIQVPEYLRDAQVPVFILQPFVENALKHGVLRGRGANEIIIAAHADGATLVLDVRDDGCGLPAAGYAATGVGISNARRRLEQMYGNRATLSVQTATDAPGVDVRINLPLVLGIVAAPPSTPARAEVAL
jgi:two-component system, LytTR family, sensor kinase